MGIGTREGQNTNLMQTTLLYSKIYLPKSHLDLCMSSGHIQKDILGKELSGETVPPRGCYSGWEGNWVRCWRRSCTWADSFPQEKKEGNWSGLCRQTCLFLCRCVHILWRLLQDARAMPMLFNWEGEASEHKQYSLKAKHRTSVWREGAPQSCEQKVPPNLEKGYIWGHWEPSPLVVLLWELSTGSAVTLNWLRQWEADGSERIRVDTQGSFSWWAGLWVNGRLLLEDLQKCLRKTWARRSGSKGTWVIVVKGTFLVATA